MIPTAFSAIPFDWGSPSADESGITSPSHPRATSLRNAVIAGSSRGLRGGSWLNLGDANSLASSDRTFFDPSVENFDFGFRLASVPEPSSLVLSVLASGVVLLRRKR